MGSFYWIILDSAKSDWFIFYDSIKENNSAAITTMVTLKRMKQNLYIFYFIWK